MPASGHYRQGYKDSEIRSGYCVRLFRILRRASSPNTSKHPVGTHSAVKREEGVDGGSTPSSATTRGFRRQGLRARGRGRWSRWTRYSGRLASGCLVGDLVTTANTYSHVLADEAELDYAEVLR